MVAEAVPTHFEIFGLPQSFEVDRRQLDTRFRELQREVHPDRFASADDQVRRRSMQQATLINEAYQVLSDPLLRGRYLLQLTGHEYDDEHHTTRDAAFLMEQMELREALADVPGAEDAFGRLALIMERIEADINGLERQLASELGKLDASAGAAADTLVKMQFFRKLQDEAVELEVRLEDEMG